MANSQGYYLEDLSPGMRAELTRVITEEEVEAFAKLTGDFNPVHIDEAYAAKTMFKTRIVHGAFTASIISAVMGTEMPGPGAIFRSLNLNYRGPMRVGESVTARVEIAAVDVERQLVTLSIACFVNGKKVVRGEAGAWVARRPQAAAAE